MKKKILFILSLLLFSFGFNFLFPSKIKASFGYDLQLSEVDICYKNISQTSQGFWQGVFQIKVKVQNNGIFASPSTNVALHLGDQLGFYGYPTVTTCSLPSIEGGKVIFKLCEQGLVYDYGNWAWVDINDDNNSNNDYYGINWLKPCPQPTSQPPSTICPLGLSQEQGSLKATINNEWKYYVSFTPKASGWVNWIQVKAGNWGNAWRNISCQVTLEDSNQAVSVLRSSEMFRADSGANWRNLDFQNTPFFLIAGKTYRLYCKGPDSWGSLYWIYSQLNNPESKTYRIYLCPVN